MHSKQARAVSEVHKHNISDSGQPIRRRQLHFPNLQTILTQIPLDTEEVLSVIDEFLRARQFLLDRRRCEHQ
jgi:hypothetical protein